MSRVIKFRIWNGKKMLFPNAIDGFVTGIDNHTCYCSNDGWWDIKPSELMQYTGLKDSKGVEIYESDLVCLSDNDDMWSPIECTVVFKGAAFRLEPSPFVCGIDLLSEAFDEDTSVNVTGNIHEEKS